MSMTEHNVSAIAVDANARTELDFQVYVVYHNFRMCAVFMKIV